MIITLARPQSGDPAWCPASECHGPAPATNPSQLRPLDKTRPIQLSGSIPLSPGDPHTIYIQRLIPPCSHSSQKLEDNRSRHIHFVCLNLWTYIGLGPELCWAVMSQGCCLVRPGPGPPFCRVEGSWGICLGSMLSPSWAEYWPYRAVQCCVRRLPGQCCQSVQCVWVISDNIINYLKKSADQCPATGCGSVKTSLTWHGESLSRRTSQSCVTWGMGWGLRGEWWAAQWVDQSYQISSSELTQHLSSQTEKIIFSKLDSSGLGPEVIKCASNNKVPPTNVKECVQHWW